MRLSKCRRLGQMHRRIGVILWIGLGSLVCSCSAPSPTGSCSVIPLRTYTPTFNAALAGEVEEAPVAAVWPIAVQDYATLRDQVRACKGAR